MAAAAWHLVAGCLEPDETVCPRRNLSLRFSLVSVDPGGVKAMDIQKLQGQCDESNDYNGFMDWEGRERARKGE